MPTNWSTSLIPTSRQVPAEAEVPSHQLMLRAGFIRKLGAGVYDYLPLGLRSLHKVMAIIREEMAAAGAVEVLLPALIPIELFKDTKRDEAYGDNLFRVKDRHGRLQALGPTHEEVVTEMFSAYVESYRQLPLTLYQIQTKFRDEFRPRFGVLRSREFLMKDAYSFHLALEGKGGLDEIYQKQYDAYCRIFARCGLPYEIVEAESGPIGGSASHEFMVPSPTGEDTILKSDKGNYAANVEKCEIGPRPISETFIPFTKAHPLLWVGPVVPAQPPKGSLEKIHTPNCPGINDVCEFFKKNLGSKLATKNMLKTLVFKILFQGPTARRYVLAIVRGDHDVNEAKLKTVIANQYAENPNFAGIELAPLDEARQDGFAIGFVGPHVARKADMAFRLHPLVVDPDATIDQFWVTGANETDHHVKGFDWKRDYIDNCESTVNPAIIVADIRNAVDGDPSPKNDGGILRTTKGIEIGHVFKLGDKYTRAMNVTVLTEDNQRVHPIMGCYGIGVNRILASAVERSAPQKGHDENGIIWPASIAPYHVIITTIKHEGEMKQAACGLASQLEALGCDVLIDDRDERPGVKFVDADLIGIPLRITIGDKGLKEGKVELKARNGSLGPKGELVALENAAQRAIEALRTL